MRNLLKIFPFLLILVLLSCDEDVLLPSTFSAEETLSGAKDKVDTYKATGEVEVTFISNPGGGENGHANKPEEGAQKFADVVFNAHEGDLKKDPKGSIEITMKNKEGAIKRTFLADVYDVKVDPITREARFLAVVISDIRSDKGHSDHDSGDDGHTDGDHSGGNHSDGDGGHDEGEGGHDEGEGGHNGSQGNQSRVGQTLGVKVYDGGSPGTNGDTIGWKWFGAGNPNTPSLEHPSQWDGMHDKEIIAGNLVVHVK